MNIEELRTAGCQRTGIWGSSCLYCLCGLISTGYVDWSVLALGLFAFFHTIFLPGKWPDTACTSGKALNLHSSGQKRVAWAEVTTINSNAKPEPSVPLLRPEKSQRKLRNQFKADCFCVSRRCRPLILIIWILHTLCFLLKSSGYQHVLGFTRIAPHNSP